MVVYRFTTFSKDGKVIHIYTTSARKAEGYLEKYAHMPDFQGSHVFGQEIDAKKWADMNIKEEEI